MSKKCTLLEGMLTFPLTVGAKAVITHNGQRIITSTVMSISEVSPSKVVFETMNTFYCIALNRSGDNAQPAPSFVRA